MNQILFVFIKITAIVSLLCTSFTILTYILFKRKYPGSLVLNMSLCSFFVSFATLIHHQETKQITLLCILQGAILQYFGLALILWYSTLSFNLFLMVAYKKKEFGMNYSFIFHAVCWGIPFIFTVFPLGIFII